MNLSDKKGVQLIVQFLAKAGVKNVVLSPGSRNAPLSLSFHHHPDFNCRIIADERVAAYHALGISLYTQQPTVLVCTSGTAVLNYAPAIAEAYYQHIPLIILTADRPAEWIDQGDGQTIRQENVYSNYILKSFSLSGDSSDSKNTNEILNQALAISLRQKGPVHLNIALEEPLYQLSEIKEDFAMVHPIELPVDFIAVSELKELENIYAKATKVMIIAGQMNSNKALNESLAQLAKKENVLVFTENTSNVFSEDFISCIDRFIDGFTETEKAEFQPDLLITIGGAVVSKKIKSWLRNFKPAQHWKIGREDLEMDTYRSKTRSIPVSADFFIRTILSFKNSSSDYRKKCTEYNVTKRTKSQDFLKQTEFTDLKVMESILHYLPNDSILHLGNSSPVRYAQLLDAREDLIYYSNRGTSGIDGCTSTAAGMADVSQKCITLISGDISFFYDSNALWNDHLKNLKVIVINNGGGGIFRIIDQPKDMHDTEKLFETRHTRTVEGLTRAFGLNYLQADSQPSLEKSLQQLYENNFPTILEIFTPTEKNALILKQYFAYLKNN